MTDPTPPTILQALGNGTMAAIKKPYIALWWILVLAVFWHSIGYDVLDAVFVWYHDKALPPPQPFSLSDILAMIGAPTEAHLSFTRNRGAD